MESNIRSGDQFDFVGIGEAPKDTGRRLIVMGVLSDGKLYGVQIHNAPSGSDSRNFQIPYTDALVMLEQGIWRRLP